MPSTVLFDFEGRKVSHLEAHNVYGSLMAKTSYEGAIAALKERPFNLSRSGFAGIQRYSALWTGDNRSSDEHMMLGIRLLNSLGLSGVPFSGMDIGGFIGTPTANYMPGGYRPAILSLLQKPFCIKYQICRTLDFWRRSY